MESESGEFEFIDALLIKEDCRDSTALQQGVGRRSLGPRGKIGKSIDWKDAELVDDADPGGFDDTSLSTIRCLLSGFPSEVVCLLFLSSISFRK